MFRTTTLSESEGADDLVSGSFLSRGNGNSGAHRFACSVDAENSSLRSARIDSRNAAASAAATPDTGYADGELTDICRSAVRDKIYNHGYIRAKFNTVSAEKSQGANYLVNGKATGETGGHESVFLFSCRVNRLTGAADSVELKAH